MIEPASSLSPKNFVIVVLIGRDVLLAQIAHSFTSDWPSLVSVSLSSIDINSLSSSTL